VSNYSTTAATTPRATTNVFIAGESAPLELEVAEAAPAVEELDELELEAWALVEETAVELKVTPTARQSCSAASSA